MGLAGAGQRLATALSSRLVAVVVVDEADAHVAALGTIADRVIVAPLGKAASDDPEAPLDAAAAVLKTVDPTAVLLANDSLSQEIAPRLAWRLHGSAAGDATTLAAEGDRILATRGVYGGKAVATLALERLPAVVWIRARAYAAAEPRAGAATTAERFELSTPSPARLKLVDRHVEARSAARLEDAKVIVSGGRGLGGPEPFTELAKLAAVLHAEMAASRAACDAGWVPPSWQVGQTGRKVAPELYLAVAISGASQHMMGIADAKQIAAINRDPDAPIFKHCRFGLVEDYRKVIQPLCERLATLDS